MNTRIELGTAVDAAITEAREERKNQEDRRVARWTVVAILLGIAAGVLILLALPGLMGY